MIVNRCAVVKELPVVHRIELAKLSNEVPSLNFPVGMYTTKCPEIDTLLK